jgi:hypothetical protein
MHHADDALAADLDFLLVGIGVDDPVERLLGRRNEGIRLRSCGLMRGVLVRPFLQDAQHQHAALRRFSHIGFRDISEPPVFRRCRHTIIRIDRVGPKPLRPRAMVLAKSFRPPAESKNQILIRLASIVQPD